MKRERPYKTAYKAWANGMLGVISAALVVTKNAANVDDYKTMTNTVMDLVQDAFAEGWDAAIDYCMQPEEEVPAGTAIPNEHTSNKPKPIVASAEGKVND